MSKQIKPLSRPPANSEGIFYCLPLPMKQWRLCVLWRAPTAGELSHPTWWQRKLAPRLASVWARHLSRSAADFAEFANLPYCAPRGRVSRHGQRCRVYHGDDLPAPVTRHMVETKFNLQNPRWVFDEHETTQEFDRRTFAGLTSR